MLQIKATIFRDKLTKPQILNIYICKDEIYSVILQKEYTYLKSKELEELPLFRVMSWQPS